MSDRHDAGVTTSGRRVTAAQIAEEAGVSVPTVSRVLNRHADVSPETRERVERLLAKRGYRRRARLRTNGRLLDLVFPDLDSPWAVEIIRGVEETAHAEGVGTVVSAIHGQCESARQWLQNVRERDCDAVIFVTSHLEPELSHELGRIDVPTVVVDPTGHPDPFNHAERPGPVIGATNWAGGLSATQHLLSLGHQRIGMIAGPPRLLCSRARTDGYRSALEAAGIPVDPALMTEGDFYHMSGFECGKALLTGERPPTAVFVASDQMALGLYEAARQLGLRIPDDVSVVGFDDLPEGRWASPPLTTVRQPLAEMGGVAARTALRLVRGEPIDSPRVELATDLVVRDSTAPIEG
ncbi:MAG: LacI family transcriptional regulator [Actinomycetota bacterium]|nr:LacI family transcriptional regulator [Actinomycetota bacterium]